MPKLCEILTWLAALPERGITTAEDERFLRVIRRMCIRADMLREKLEELIEKLKGEEA